MSITALLIFAAPTPPGNTGASFNATPIVKAPDSSPRILKGFDEGKPTLGHPVPNDELGDAVDVGALVLTPTWIVDPAKRVLVASARFHELLKQLPPHAHESDWQPTWEASRGYWVAYEPTQAISSWIDITLDNALTYIEHLPQSDNLEAWTDESLEQARYLLGASTSVDARQRFYLLFSRLLEARGQHVRLKILREQAAAQGVHLPEPKPIFSKAALSRGLQPVHCF